MSNGVTERNIRTLSEALKQIQTEQSQSHKEMDKLKSDNLQLRSELGRIEQRINQIMVRLYSGGATSGNNN
jgi:septation ring formation regulator EzrA